MSPSSATATERLWAAGRPWPLRRIAAGRGPDSRVWPWTVLVGMGGDARIKR